MLNDPVEIFLPTPVHLFLAALLLALFAFVPALRARWNRWRLTAALLLAWVWIGCTPAIANLLILALEGPVPATTLAAPARDETTLIVVLSSGQLYAPSGRPFVRPDDDGWERLRGGVALWRETGGTLLFTGGPGDAVESSMALFMAQLATEMGVPRSAILTSPRGTTTAGELRGAREAIRQHVGPKWLVTSAMHMPRAQYAAEHFGLAMQARRVAYRQTETLTWRSWIPQNGAMPMYAAALHEWVGRLAYRFTLEAPPP